MANEFEIVSSDHIKNVNIVFNKVKYRSPHVHREFELIYQVSDQAEYRFGQGSQTVCAGDFLIFNPNQLHEIISAHGSSFIICLQIAPEFFEMFYPGIHHLEFETPYLSGLELANISVPFLELANSYLMQRPYYEFECTSLIQHIFHELLISVPHHFTSLAEKKNNEEKASRLERILDYAANHYYEKINLADLAAQENLTLNYLSRFIKQNLNRSFQDYIGELRFNHAKYLICNTRQNLIDICESCGYSDYRYLYQDFMAHVHCSPKDYRGSHSAEHAHLIQSSDSQEEILTFDQALRLLGMSASQNQP